MTDASGTFTSNNPTFSVNVAAGLTPMFNVTSVSIPQGMASETLTGTIGYGGLTPPAGETVAVTLDGVTHDTLTGAQGSFSTTFNTGALPGSNIPYVVTYTYGGDTNLTAATDNTTTVVVAPLTGAEVAVYRLYSPVTKEHLYTSDANEYATLQTRGWNDEGVAYGDYDGLTTGNGVTDEPLYRLYNPSIKQHLWTTDVNEWDMLATQGWVQEEVAGYVFPTALSAHTYPLYRMNYPATATNADLHLWTIDLNEYNTDASSYGWTQEGIVGYVLGAPVMVRDF